MISKFEHSIELRSFTKRKIWEVKSCTHLTNKCFEKCSCPVFFCVGDPKATSVFRSSRQRCSVRKGGPRNSTKLICVRVSFLIKLQAFGKPATLSKKRLWHSCFPVNFVKFQRTRFFIEHPWWLPLRVVFLKQSNEYWISFSIP